MSDTPTTVIQVVPVDAVTMNAGYETDSDRGYHNPTVEAAPLELQDLGDRGTIEEPPLTTTNDAVEEALQEVLGTRPSLAVGRQMSRRRRSARSAGAFSDARGRSRYRSLPQSARRPRRGLETDGPDGLEIRRSSSFSGLTSVELRASEVVVDVELEEDGGFAFTSEFRKSSRRLRDRIAEHREKPSTARLSVWADFKVVKWPKIKSRLQVFTSYELWKGHMKEVESHFGTAVVSYFIFLRWLFVMNLIIFAFWFGFVVIPQIAWVHANDPSHTTSLLSCVYPSVENAAENVSEVRVCPIGESIPVYPTPNPCFTAPSKFGIRLCKFERNDSGVLIADRESSQDNIDVMMMMPNCTPESNSSFEEYRMCVGGIDPYVQWYQYILDFVLGQGALNETVLFHGWYTNTTVTEHTDYDMPIAFLVLISLVYLISMVLLVYKMGYAYNESYVEFGSKRKANFCDKVFTAWDFNITASQTAKLKRAHIRTDFEEELADHIKRNTVRTAKEIVKVILVRIATNTFTLLVLTASGVAIYYTATYSLDALTSSSVSPQGLVLPMTITAFNIILPFVFSFLARFERFKTQGGEIKMTLLRVILVRLSSLVILLVTLFILIECTQNSQDMVVGTEVEAAEEEDVCEFDPLSFVFTRNSTSGTSNRDENCPVCWETFFGQEFYKLGLINFAVSSTSTVFVETTRNIVSRIRWKGLGQRLGKGTFNIPKSILDLIYTQSLLWLGFMFSPLLPAIILLTSFVQFYVKKYSLLLNLQPSNRGTFRAARTNFLFLLLMLLALFAVLIPIGYIIAREHPSATCGPFRGQQYMYTVFNDRIDDISNCELQEFLSYIGSTGFILPIIVLLLLIVYAQYVTLRSRKQRFNLIKKQLILEGANVTHIVGKLDGVLQKIADQRALHEAVPAAGPQYYLPERIQQMRKESRQQ